MITRKPQTITIDDAQFTLAPITYGEFSRIGSLAAARDGIPLDLMQEMVASCLQGWTGVDIPFSSDAIGLLPARVILTLGRHVMDEVGLSGDDRKN